ncbi:hypothetical protein DFH06DRAFT_1119229 [Mycena polygramma]|nr:hypothetical protein DFH06DRAFT_1119229 [Mycena polygramma]
MEKFNCFLVSSDTRRNLGFMGDIAARSDNLRFLGLHFEWDLFGISTRSRQALMSSFCGLLSTFATSRGSPGDAVFIFSGSDVFSCVPQDIANWSLDVFQFDPTFGPRGLLNRARRTVNSKVVPPPRYELSTKIRLHSGKQRTVTALTSLRSVTMESIRHDSNPLHRFTILVFNSKSITRLSLTPIFGSNPPDLLNVAIVHVLLPCLRNVYIGMDTLNPFALRIFLSRHPTIKRLDSYGGGKDSDSCPMVDPPLAHPGLTEIHVSPGGIGFAFAFTGRLVSADLRRLLLDLRLISACTNEATLQLCLVSFLLHDKSLLAGEEVWSLDEAREIAKTLHCVRSVELACFALEDGRAAISWLALLPAVAGIQFGLHLSQFGGPELTDEERTSELAKFLGQAHAELPHDSINFQDILEKANLLLLPYSRVPDPRVTPTHVGHRLRDKWRDDRALTMWSKLISASNLDE